jgi:hypothetical protein
MTRHAVEDFLRENPNSLPTSAQAPREPVTDTASDQHPYNRGQLIGCVGSLTVYMFHDDPGKYYLDTWGKYPATESQARAAFTPEEVARHKQAAEDLAQQRRIDQAVDQAVQARDQEPESLKDKANRIAKVEQTKWLRENARRIQAQADQAATRWLDEDRIPTPQA